MVALVWRWFIGRERTPFALAPEPVHTGRHAESHLVVEHGLSTHGPVRQGLHVAIVVVQLAREFD